MGRQSSTLSSHTYLILSSLLIITLTSLFIFLTPLNINASPTSTSPQINEKTAVQRFNKQFKNINVSEISLKSKGNQWEYKVSGNDDQNKYTAYVDGKTSKITRANSRPLNLGEQKANLNSDLANVISRKAANRVAEHAIRGGSGKSWRLVELHGIPIWEIQVKNKHHQITTVKVNANNKKIVNVSQAK